MAQGAGAGASARGIVWLVCAVLGVLVALPLAFIGLQAVFPELARGSLAHPFGALAQTFADPALLELTANTMRLALTVVGFAALLGVPLGVLRGACRVPAARFWDVALLLPFLVPPYIAAMGWIMLLQPNGYLQQLGGPSLQRWLFSFWGVAFVMTLNVFPVVYFAVSRSVAATGLRLAEVGRVCGASPWQCLWRIVVPLALPALAASLLLVFAMAIEEYGTPAVLASDAGFFVLVTGIERRFSEWPIDLPGAALLSMILVALGLAAFCTQRALLARRGFETTAGKPAAQAAAELGPWRWPVLVLFGLVVLVAVVAPLFSVASTSLLRTLSGGLAWDNLSFAHYAAIGREGGEATRALGNSLVLGLGAACVTGALGALIAYCVVTARVRGSGLIDALSLLPNTMPGIVVAVGLILVWNQRWWPATPYNTWVILVLAYSCLLLPITVRYANAALRQIGPGLEAAARVHGASAAMAIVRILLPLMAPSLAAAMLLVFAIASRELVASLLLAPTGMQTVSVFVWRQFEQGSLGQGMAMSVLAIAMTASVMALAGGLLHRRGGSLTG
ncbi:iron ABC transporter permease [Verticiella sediminum]|uniref:Iron ABC transporter permease n=2 Tax=Verticiella sediminum TaxID=1247510 RepID=A0A556A8G1_9BURK|nr:iron ABC transporter permease [Verticiella sediminum]